MNTFMLCGEPRLLKKSKDKIAEQTADMKDVEPKNLEEQAIKLIGPDIYEKLIKGYTEKQWGRSATDLPPFIIKRLPVRLTLITTTLMTVTKEFQSVVTTSSLKICWAM